MSILSNKQIIEARESGHVVIEPYVHENVRKASLDFTLGEWFYRADAGEGGIYNPFDEVQVQRHFAGPFQAKPYFNVWRKMVELASIGGLRQTNISMWPPPQGVDTSETLILREPSDRSGDDLAGIPYDHPIIMLLPGERILAHTHEFAGIRAPGTTKMYARSSWGRNGISVCLCAGVGDPGYINRWTMEITNFNPRAAVPLPVGERVAQLIFYETGETYGGTYGAENGYESKYQQSDDLAEVIAAWRPSAMLPRSYKDKRRLPAPGVGFSVLRSSRPTR